MKNREIRAFIASMMLVSLVAGSLLPVSANVPANGETTVIAAEYTGAENTETAKQESVDKEETDKKREEKTSTSSSEDSAAKPTKSETVYAKIDGTGWGCCTRDQKISDVTAPSSKKSSFFIEIREVLPVVFLDGRTFPGPVTRQGLSLLNGLFLCAFL